MRIATVRFAVAPPQATSKPQLQISRIGAMSANGPIATFASKSGLRWSKCRNHQDH